MRGFSTGFLTVCGLAELWVRSMQMTRLLLKNIVGGLLLLAANSVKGADVSLGDFGAGFPLVDPQCLSLLLLSWR